MGVNLPRRGTPEVRHGRGFPSAPDREPYVQSFRGYVHVVPAARTVCGVWENVLDRPVNRPPHNPVREWVARGGVRLEVVGGDQLGEQGGAEGAGLEEGGAVPRDDDLLTPGPDRSAEVRRLHPRRGRVRGGQDGSLV